MSDMKFRIKGIAGSRLSLYEGPDTGDAMLNVDLRAGTGTLRFNSDEADLAAGHLTRAATALGGRGGTVNLDQGCSITPFTPEEPPHPDGRVGIQITFGGTAFVMIDFFDQDDVEKLALELARRGGALRRIREMKVAA